MKHFLKYLDGVNADISTCAKMGPVLKSTNFYSLRAFTLPSFPKCGMKSFLYKLLPHSLLLSLFFHHQPTSSR